MEKIERVQKEAMCGFMQPVVSEKLFNVTSKMSLVSTATVQTVINCILIAHMLQRDRNCA